MRTDSRSGNAALRITVIAAALVALLTQQATAASTSPGKNAVFVSANGVPLVAFGSTLLTGQILKGKKKTVLVVEAMYTDGPYSPTASATRVLGLTPTVNGVLLEPSIGGNSLSGQGTVVDCGFAVAPPAACAVNGTWWLDIDAAELANPGTFVGQPLNISLTGGDLTVGTLVGVQLMDATMTVRVQKK